MKIGLIVDILLIVVIIATAIRYKKKGFVSGIIDLVGNLLSLALAWIVSGKVSPGIFENFFASGLIGKTTQALQEQGTTSVTGILDGLQGVLPQRFLDSISLNAASIFGNNAGEVAQQVVEKIIAPLVIPLITVLVFFATYLICRIVIAFLVATLSNINKIPILGGVNRSLGIVIGLVVGVFNVILILCLLWAIVMITGGQIPALNDATLSGSYLYTFFSAYNPFV